MRGVEGKTPEGGQSDNMRSFDRLCIAAKSTNVLIDGSLLLILVSPVSDHVMNSCPLHIMLMQSEASFTLLSPAVGGCETEIQVRKGSPPYSIADSTRLPLCSSVLFLGCLSNQIVGSAPPQTLQQKSANSFGSRFS
jgi:hypothetical protein